MGFGWANPLQKKDRSWDVFVLFLATATYVVFELAFNASLVDVVGSDPSADTVDKIQIIGRILSGFAVALLLWPFCLNKKSEVLGIAVTTFTVTIIVISIVYVAEEKLVDWLVSKYTPRGRYVALHAVSLKKLLVTEDIDIEGLNIKNKAGADSKTFYATFPLIASTVKDIHLKIAKEKPHIVRRLVDRGYGGFENFRKNYAESVRKLRELYETKYTRAVRKHRESVGKIDEKIAKAWDEYRDELRKNNINPDDIPDKYYDRIRDEVRKKGIPVPDDWDPHDRETFENALSMKKEKEIIKADETFIKKAKRTYGISVPPGLSFDHFISHGDVQRRWREALNVPPGINLSPGMKDGELKGIYNRVLDSKQAKLLAMYNCNEKEFDLKGKYYDKGISYTKAMVVPAVSLVFSMSGLFVHIFKVTAYILHIITGYELRRKFLIFPLLTVMTFLVFNLLPLSKVTEQDLFVNVAVPSLNSKSPCLTYAIRGTIHMQKITWPVSNLVRQKTGLFAGITGDSSEKPDIESLRKIKIDLL